MCPRKAENVFHTLTAQEGITRPRTVLEQDSGHPPCHGAWAPNTARQVAAKRQRVFTV